MHLWFFEVLDPGRGGIFWELQGRVPQPTPIPHPLLESSATTRAIFWLGVEGYVHSRSLTLRLARAKSWVTVHNYLHMMT